MLTREQLEGIRAALQSGHSWALETRGLTIAGELASARYIVLTELQKIAGATAEQLATAKPAVKEDAIPRGGYGGCTNYEYLARQREEQEARQAAESEDAERQLLLQLGSLICGTTNPLNLPYEILHHLRTIYVRAKDA